MRNELGGLLERGVGVGEALDGVGVDGAEQRDEEVGKVGEAVSGEAREVREGGERVGERGGDRRGGDGEEGGERSAVGVGDGVGHAREVVADAAVRLTHAQVRRHLQRRRPRWGLGFPSFAAAAGRKPVHGYRFELPVTKGGCDQLSSPSRLVAVGSCGLALKSKLNHVLLSMFSLGLLPQIPSWTTPFFSPDETEFTELLMFHSCFIKSRK